MMKLLGFRVKQFRSIEDSGWIDADNVTTLVGVNESGKSNLLLALWKLQPAKEGKIDLLRDLPREQYSSKRDNCGDDVFIEAKFELDDAQVEYLMELTNAQANEIRIVEVARKYNGRYTVGFPQQNYLRKIKGEIVQPILISNLEKLQKLEEVGKGENGLKKQSIEAFNTALSSFKNEDDLSKFDVQKIIDCFNNITSTLKTSEILPLIEATQNVLRKQLNLLNEPLPGSIQEARDYVKSELPSFVYYSNYGNLDSEIYLPHVIENLKRDDLTGTIAAKTRTLRVLFDFVNLDAEEILEKGNEPEAEKDNRGVIKPPTEEAIQTATEAKKERDVLLQSASSQLTKKFRGWWKQGEYTFNLVADGSHFRIWVSDEIRPSQIELENRSTGLQWFLSFFLVFLVESQEAHKGSILLLDEAGLSLHPLAQKDLTAFFDNLSTTNQIVHTTHSPFLIDTNHIDRVKVVYVDSDGNSVTSGNLRENEPDPKHSKSIYAVHAALGLSISDILLQGCYSVVVEGPSDQYYLSAIKLVLIREGRIAPNQEIVFVPSGGVRGVAGIAGILSAKEDELPFVLTDSDSMGKTYKEKLQNNLYKGISERIVEINDVLSILNGEVEDLLPLKILTPSINRLFKDVDDVLFEDAYDDSKAIVPQIIAFSEKNKILLPKGWKVDIARQVKTRLLKNITISDSDLDNWTKLFQSLYPELIPSEELDKE